MSGLIGKWLHILDGEFSRTGQVMLADGPDHYLVKIAPVCDCEGKPPPMSELLMRDELCSCAEMEHYVVFFDSEELKTWLEWMSENHSDDEPTRVVPMNKRKEH